MTKTEEQALEKKETLSGYSFRLSKETSEAFREISKDLGENQEYAMSVLIDSYKGIVEKNQLKNPDKYDEFEKYLSVLKDLYMNSLRATDDANILAKQEYASQLLSKDNIILELQERLKNTEIERDTALKELTPVKDELGQVVLTLSEAKNTIEALNEEKDDIKASCDEKVEKLTRELEEVRADDKKTRSLYEENVKTIVKLEGEIDALKKAESPLKDNLSKLTGDNKALTTRNEFLERENESLLRDIDSLKTSKEAEIELAKKQAALEMKAEMFDQIQSLRDELDEFKKKYMDVLENNKKSK